MRRFGLIALIVLGVVCPLGNVVLAQEEEVCDPHAVKVWLMKREAWINATTDVMNNSSASKEIFSFVVLEELQHHSQAIADLERPACRDADSVMLWTYYFYDAVERLYLCSILEDTECLNELNDRMASFPEQFGVAIVRLVAPIGEYGNYEDLRPEGWVWPPDEADSLIVEPYTEGMLNFEGSGDIVSDVIQVPAGVYRANLHTESDYMSVNMIVVSGECFQGNDTWQKALFSMAVDGAQAVLTSESCELMWQTKSYRGTFNVSFEKIR